MSVDDRAPRNGQHPSPRRRPSGVVTGLVIFLAAALALLWFANHELAPGGRVAVTAIVIAVGLAVGLLAGRRLRRR